MTAMPPTNVTVIEATDLVRLSDTVGGARRYDSAMAEYKRLSDELARVERAMAAKLAEVNAVASVENKPAVVNGRRIVAELVSVEEIAPRRRKVQAPLVVSAGSFSIAAALNGQVF